MKRRGDLGLAGNADSQAPLNVTKPSTVAEIKGSAVRSFCPLWPHTTMCCPSRGILHGSDGNSISSALRTGRSLPGYFDDNRARIITQQRTHRDFSSAPEFRTCPSWGAEYALLIAIFGGKNLSVAKLSSFRLVVFSLDTQRHLWGNDLTTLPDGLFEGLTALTQL